HGIYLGGPNGVITNNIVTRASAACIHLFHGTTHEIVSNNVVANCGMFGIEVSAGGGTTDDYTTVDNNIIVNVNGRGIYEFPSTGCHNVYNNNVVYNNAPNLELICGTQAGTLTLTSAQFNALFVNYTGDMNGDYHLRSGAAAIDAGTISCAAGVTSCVPLLDWDGVARPVGAAYGALAGIVAFEQTGVIDARNGGAYTATATIPYSAGTTYHVRLKVNIASHTYAVYVTPAGASEQLLGSNFAFRTEQAAVNLL